MTTPAPRRKRGETRDMLIRREPTMPVPQAVACTDPACRLNHPHFVIRTATSGASAENIPTPVTDGERTKPQRNIPNNIPAPAPSWEVIRTHVATCRVQLAGWDIIDEAKAERLAATLNARTVAAGGVTLASSGLLERGWLYSARRAS